MEFLNSLLDKDFFNRLLGGKDSNEVFPSSCGKQLNDMTFAGELERFWFRAALILLSALLAGLCLPSSASPWLAFVVLVPLALGLRDARPVQGLLLGLLFGFSVWLISTWWTVNSLMNMLGWSFKAALAGCVLLCLYQALPYALSGLLCGWANKQNLKTGPFFCASLLTLSVYFLPEVFQGSLAHTLYSWPAAIQTAELGGVHLVHFLLLLCNWLLAEYLSRLYRQEKALPVLILFLALLTGIFIYGRQRIDYYNSLAEGAAVSKFMRVACIQPNIPIKGNAGIDSAGPFAGTTGALVKATNQAAEKMPDADLILWPEVPRTVSCTCADFEKQGVTAASGKVEAPILLSCTEFDYGKNSWIENNGGQQDGAGRHTPEVRKIDKKYNSVCLVEQSTCRLAYRKIKLIPFGERTPFQNSLPWIKEYFGRALEYSPGNILSLVDLPGGKRVQPLICYEGGFPEFASQGVRLGAQAMVNVSNDAWFDSAKAAEFHLALTLFRAVEQRRPLVRCTNSGFGAHVRATGEIVAGTLTPMNEAAMSQASLYCPEQKTLYSRTGDAWLWILAIIMIFKTVPLRKWTKSRS